MFWTFDAEQEEPPNLTKENYPTARSLNSFFYFFQTTNQSGQPQTVTVTVTGNQNNNGTNNSGTKIIQTLNSVQTSANNPSNPTIIQPTQGGQQFIVTSKILCVNK